MASSGASRGTRRRKVAQPRSVRGIVPYTSETVFDLLAEDLGEVEHRPRLDGTSELCGPSSRSTPRTSTRGERMTLS